MAEEHRALPHTAILENRKRLTLTGVRTVEGFDAETVTLTTELGVLTVRGSALHIERFDVETGELAMDGEVCALVYSADTDPGRGFFRRMLR